MSLSIEEWKNATAAAQSVATVASFLIGGVWVYLRYIRQQERYPNIESSADIQLIGTHGEYWIAELIATVENKGKAQHRMSEFRFDLNGIGPNDPVNTDSRWGGQVDFPHQIAAGSFLPERYEFFYVDPGVTAKYSFVTRIPVQMSFVNLHWWFKYGDNRQFRHVAERTIQVCSRACEAQGGPDA